MRLAVALATLASLVARDVRADLETFVPSWTLAERAVGDDFDELLASHRVLVAPATKESVLIVVEWEDQAQGRAEIWEEDHGQDWPVGVWLMRPGAPSQWLRSTIAGCTFVLDVEPSPSGRWLAVCSYLAGEGDCLHILRLPALVDRGQMDVAWSVQPWPAGIAIDGWLNDDTLLVSSDGMIDAPRDENGHIFLDCGDELSGPVYDIGWHRFAIDVETGSIEATSPRTRAVNALPAYRACVEQCGACTRGAEPGEGTRYTSERGRPPKASLEDLLDQRGVHVLRLREQTWLVAASGLSPGRWNWSHELTRPRAATLEGSWLRPLRGDFGSLYEIDDVELSPDRRFLAVLSEGACGNILDLVAVEDLLSSREFTASVHVEPFPGFIDGIEWKGGRLNVRSNVPLFLGAGYRFDDSLLREDMSDFTIDPRTLRIDASPSVRRLWPDGDAIPGVTK